MELSPQSEHVSDGETVESLTGVELRAELEGRSVSSSPTQHRVALNFHQPPANILPTENYREVPQIAPRRIIDSLPSK